jgi:hypothetical protein
VEGSFAQARIETGKQFRKKSRGVAATGDFGDAAPTAAEWAIWTTRLVRLAILGRMLRLRTRSTGLVGITTAIWGFRGRIGSGARTRTCSVVASGRHHPGAADGDPRDRRIGQQKGRNAQKGNQLLPALAHWIVQPYFPEFYPYHRH